MSTLLDLGFIAVARGVHEVALEHTPFHHWGDTCQEDSLQNDESVTDGSRILSVYNIPKELCKMSDRIWIITEAVSSDTGRREYTTVLFPSEY